MKTQSSAASAHPTLFGFKIGYFVFAFVTIFVAGFVYAYPRTIEVRDTQNYGVPFTADARLILRDRDSSQIFYKEFSKVKLDSKGYLISYTPDWFELPRHLIADVCFKRGDTDAKGELTSVPYCEGAVAPANYKGYVIRSCENRLIPWNLVSLTRTVEFSGLCNAKGQDIAMAVTNNAGDIVPVVAGDKDTDINNDTNIDNGIDNNTNNASNVSWIVTNPTQTVTNNNTIDMQDCEDDEVLVWDNGQWNCRDVDDLVTNGTGGTPALPQNNIFVGDATNTAAPYAPGANGDVLSIVGGTPTWTPFSGGVATNTFTQSRATGYTSNVNGIIGTQSVPTGVLQEITGYNAGGAPVYQSVASVLSGNTTNTTTIGGGNLTTTVNGVVSNLSLSSLFANPNGGNLTGPGPIVVTGGAGAVLGAGATVDCPTCITTTSTGLTGDLIAGSNVVFTGSGLDKLVGATNVTVGISANPSFTSLTTTAGPNNFAGTTNTTTLNTTGTFTASGPVSFTGPTFTTSAGTTSTFNGPTNITNTLTTSGTVVNNGPVTNNGTTTLNGATTVNNSFTTTGPNNLGGNTTVNNLTVTGTFTLPPASTGDVVAGTGVTLTGLATDRLVGASNLTIGIDPATIAVTAANSITGNGSTGTPLQLSGDVAAPGNNFFYGTSGAGVKGWQNLATAVAGATTNTLGSAANTMTSTVNGVVATAPIINTNTLTVGGGNLTNTTNGVAGSVSLASLFAAASGGNLTGPGPIVVTGGAGAVLGAGATVDCPTCITTTSTGLTGDLIAGSNVVFTGSGLDKLVGATNVTVGITNTPTFDSITTTVGPNNFAGATNTTGTLTASGPVSFTGPTFTTSAGTTSTFNGPTNLNGVTNVNNTLNTTGPNNLGGTTTVNNLNVTGTTTFTTLPNLPLALGNIFVGNAGGNAQAYAPGANGDLLQVVAGIPTWSSAASVLSGATTNTLGSAANTMTSTVNGVVATAPIVNSISNTSVGNSLSTTVNGVTGAPVSIINSTLLSWNQATGITSTVNGVSGIAPNPTGVIAALLGFDAAGDPVNQTVASVLTAATCPVAGTFACQNGNTYGANAVYGTNDAFALNFETNNTVRGGFAANGNFNVDTSTLFVDSINNRVGINSAAPVAGFQNNSATLFGTGGLGDFAAGGAIGSAAATVDSFTSLNIGQTTAGQTLTIPAPTNATAGRILYVQNNGSQSFNMLGAGVAAGGSIQAIWNGTAWVRTGGASGAGVPINTLQNSTGSGSLQVAAAHTLNWDFLNTTANAMTMNFLAQTSGNGLTINSFNTPTSGSSFLVNSTSNGNLANGAARINLTGNHTGTGFVIDDATNAGGTAMAINVPNNVNGNGLTITGNATTGDLFNVTAAGGAYATDGVVDFTFGSHTGVGVGINSGASSGTALHVNTVGLNGGSAIQITTPQNESALTMVDVTNAEQVAVVNGIADPNGTVNKPNGSMYFRTSAGNQGWYMNTSAGTGGTVWTLIAGPTGTNNIYNNNGTLTSNRTLTHGGFDLTFDGSAQDVVFDTTGQFLVNTTTPVAGKVAVFNGDVDVTGAIDPNAILFSDGVAGAFNPVAAQGYKLGQATGASARPIFVSTLANQATAFQVRQSDDTTVAFNVDNINSRVGIGGITAPTAQIQLGAGGAGTGIAFNGVATGTPSLSAANQGRIFYNSTTNAFQCSSNGAAYVNCLGAAPSSALSAITAATATNTIANGTFAQTWGWNGVAGTDDALTLSSTSASTSGAVLAIDMALGGANASGLQIDAQTGGFASRISNNNGQVAAFYDNGLTDTTFAGIDANGNLYVGTNGLSLNSAKLSVNQDSGSNNVLGLATTASTSAGYNNQVFLRQSSPEGTQTANRGDLALVNDLSVGALYVKTSGANGTGTGWSQVLTGDLTGKFPLSSLASATATNTTDNLNFNQAWNWSTLTTQNAFSMAANAMTSGNILSLTSTSATQTGANLNISNNAGIGVNIASAGTAFTGVNIATVANSQSTGNSIAVNTGAGLTTGAGLSLTNSSAGTTLSGLLQVTGTANHNGSLVSFVDNATTGGTVQSISSTALTTGTALSFTGGTYSTGSSIGITQTGGAAIISNTPGEDLTTPSGNTLIVRSGTTGAATFDSGTTGAVNIATNSNAKAITIGNATGATGLTVLTGTAGEVNTSTTTTNNAMSVTANSLTSGNALRLTSTSGARVGVAGTAGSGLLSVNGAANDAELVSLTDSTNTCTLNPGATLGITCTSDASLKKNISNSDSILAALNQMQIRKYDWKSDGTHARYGVIAQEVAATDMGYLVTTNPETGLKGVAQVDPWMLVKGLQEVDAKAEVTIAEVEALADAADAQAATLADTIANINDQNDSVESKLATLNTNDQNFLTQFNSLLDSVTVQQESINDLLATLSSLSLDVAALTGRVDALEAAVAQLSANGSEANVVGRAEIKEGDTVVHVDFDSAFDSKPVITLAPNAFIDGKYALDNVTKNGFDIKLSVEQDSDVSFDWHAFKSVNVSSSNSTGGNGGSNNDDNGSGTEGDDTPETPVTPPADETPTDETPAADDTETPADNTPAPDEGSNDEAPADDTVIPTGI